MNPDSAETLPRAAAGAVSLPAGRRSSVARRLRRGHRESGGCPPADRHRAHGRLARQLARTVDLAAGGVGGGPRCGVRHRSGTRARRVSTRPGRRVASAGSADRLAAPAARWDSVVVSGRRPARLPTRPGPGHRPRRAAFFPVYPLVMSALGALGVRRWSWPACSSRLVALAAALYRLHRLTTLELGGPHRGFPRAADRHRAPGGDGHRVLPDGVLLLSRLQRVAVPRAVDGRVLVRAPRPLGAGGRPRGLRRGDAQRRPRAPACPCAAVPVRTRERTGHRTPSPGAHGLRPALPRYRRDAAVARGWCPAGLASYLASTSPLAGGDALMPFHAQDVWHRHFAGPFVAAWDGAVAAFARRAPAAVHARRPVYFPAAGGIPLIAAEHNVVAVRLPGARRCPRSVGVLRRAAGSPTAST